MFFSAGMSSGMVLLLVLVGVDEDELPIVVVFVFVCLCWRSCEKFLIDFPNFREINLCAKTLMFHCFLEQENRRWKLATQVQFYVYPIIEKIATSTNKKSITNFATMVDSPLVLITLGITFPRFSVTSCEWCESRSYNYWHTPDLGISAYCVMSRIIIL